jgi:hypothetical protein
LKVEVKSGAFLQSWSQRGHSAIWFSISKTRAWDADTNVQAEEVKRQADVYVIALLAHQDKATLDPLDLSQWRFYVVPTGVLESRTQSAHSIGLKALEAIAGPPVTYSELGGSVRQAAQRDGSFSG